MTRVFWPYTIQQRCICEDQMNEMNAVSLAVRTRMHWAIKSQQPNIVITAIAKAYCNMTSSGYTTELARSWKKISNYLRQAQCQLQREPQSTHRERTEHRKWDLNVVSSYQSPSWLRKVPNVLQTGQNIFLGWSCCQFWKRHVLVEQLTE